MKFFAVPGAPATFHRRPPSAPATIPQPWLFALDQSLFAMRGNSPDGVVYLTQNDTEKSVSAPKSKSPPVPNVTKSISLPSGLVRNCSPAPPHLPVSVQLALPDQVPELPLPLTSLRFCSNG